MAQLAAWIEPKVTRDSDGKMHPQYGKLDGEGQFIFMKPGARAAAGQSRPGLPKLEIEEEIRQQLGSLAVTARLEGIEVWLGDQRIGETKLGRALIVKNLTAGTHRIRAGKLGHHQWERDVRVVANERTEIVIDIKPQRDADQIPWSAYSSTEWLYPKSWAVVIGIDAYKYTPPLRYAVADAKAVAALLPSLGFPRENIRVFLNADASKQQIETAIYGNLRSAIDAHDRLLVYFSGHGATLQTRFGEVGFLLPVDSKPSELPLTAIAMTDFRRIGQITKAKHVLFVMDAMFSGFALTRDIVVPRSGPEYWRMLLREPAVEVLTAGRKGEAVIESEGHGLFTRRFLDGLTGLADNTGEGLITAVQLAGWIEPRVVRDSKGKMTPQYGKLDGEGTFIFALPNARRFLSR